MGRRLGVGAGLAIAILAGGCRQVLGIEDPDTCPPAGCYEVVGRFGWTVIEPGPNNELVATEALLGPADLSLSVVLDDGTESPISYAPDGSFVFSRAHPTQAYRIVSAADARDIIADAPSVIWEPPLFGRLDRAPVSSLVPVGVSMTDMGLPPGGDSVIRSTGLRAHYAVPLPATVIFTFDWNDAFSLSGPKGLLDAARGDKLWFDYYTDEIGRRYLTATVPFDVTMKPGQTLFVQGPVAALPRDHCVVADVRLGDEIARLRQALSATGGADYTRWRFLSIARPDLSGGAWTTQLVGAATPGNQLVTSQHPGPLPGDDRIASLHAGVSLERGQPGTRQITLFNETAHFFETPTDPRCNASPVVYDGDVMIPPVPSVAGELLVEGIEIEIDSELLVEIDLQVPPGSGDYYKMNLCELPDSSITGVSCVHEYVSTRPRFSIDASYLVASQDYVLQVAIVRGAPEAQRGEFQTTTYPYRYAQVWSPTFRVK